MSLKMNLKIHRLTWAKPNGQRIMAFNVMRGEVQAGNPYSAVNLCDYTGDTPLHVQEARQELCTQLGIAPSHLIMPRQNHSNHVATIDAQFMKLDGLQRAQLLQHTDALVTPLTGVCIGVNTADCVNIALCDPQAGIIAVAHAGWRGTVARIASLTVEAMIAQGAQPNHIMASMGASICPACFEVGDEVVEEFARQQFNLKAIVHRHSATGKAHINLQRANALALQEAGILASHINWNGECSRCKSELYFSARKLGINSGRTFTGIIMKS